MAYLKVRSIWSLEAFGSDFFLEGLVLLEGGPIVEDLNSEQQTPDVEQAALQQELTSQPVAISESSLFHRAVKGAKISIRFSSTSLYLSSKHLPIHPLHPSVQPYV